MNEPVAATAVGPMVLAAVEQYEPVRRRLVDDDLASAFLPAGLRALIRAARWPLARKLLIETTERSGPGLWANLTCRKRYIGDKLTAALPDIDAVVILGAGLDTVGYRLARHSAIPVFEVDLPVNIERKRSVVHRALGSVPDSVHLVPVDFEHDDLAAELAEHGHRAQHRTFFIWEGVTQYLSADGVASTFEFLRSATPGSRLVFTYVRSDFIDGTNRYGAESLYRRFRVRSRLWQFGLNPDDVAAFIGPYGWQLAEQAGPDYLAEHYLEPSGRELAASQVEWSAYAVKR
ncbi:MULTISPECIES: SAM-dependent methyltransferase [Mycolicibacterium]|uniref:S-adenosyl-L-methionine-dependent methyltransferase n=3 Tax=Mycolicibacterium TaxID=1866885 RepID=A0A378T2U0_9MYCO|nr:MULTISPECIES: SAM-dependent methyltransferase [Mycolicibacterium]MCV7336404.1 SAM-dependent methyltransferase [Mycolicibacterium senegalense]MCW1822163.1 SAM-dependent methyltransferase [Mycolicibacterium senegalense]MDR7290934.1 methyltransferase (TIGR00027 family) [Mycolicibacterium senegalense]QZA22475.1 SAM-dependent methyltransferase [Mycolicibacterium senegalense]CDP83191.1 methyltransferase, putative, family protein [Mycolicibacterium farcinogenes]